MYLIAVVKLDIHIKFKDYLPFEGGPVLHLNKLESPLSKDDLYQVWPSGSWEEVENVKS